MKVLKKVKGLGMNIFLKHQIVINIIFDDNYGFKESVIKKIIRKTINLTLSELNDDYKKKYEVNILLAQNEQMKKINRKYRKIDKVTNVLSFPQGEIMSKLGKEKTLVTLSIFLYFLLIFFICSFWANKILTSYFFL
jgi:hypothetical protein